MLILCVACLLAAVLLHATHPSSRRLRSLVAGTSPVDLARPSTRAPTGTALLGACTVGAALGAMMLFGPAGAPIGAGAALAAGPRLQATLERRRAAAPASSAELVVTAELLAALAAAGTPWIVAVEEVASALDGPFAARLAVVARLARLGAPAHECWEPVTADGSGAAAQLARTVTAGARDGVAVAARLSLLAADLRAAERERALAAARRVGVLAVLPLGLCFLPAFLLLGVVPMVAGTLGGLLR